MYTNGDFTSIDIPLCVPDSLEKLISRTYKDDKHNNKVRTV